jgi:hypothetical protein
MKSTKMKLAVQVLRMGGRRNGQKVLVGKDEGRSSLGRRSQ